LCKIKLREVLGEEAENFLLLARIAPLVFEALDANAKLTQRFSVEAIRSATSASDVRSKSMVLPSPSAIRSASYPGE
jgi:hypothetical protein